MRSLRIRACRRPCRSVRRLLAPANPMASPWRANNRFAWTQACILLTIVAGATFAAPAGRADSTGDQAATGATRPVVLFFGDSLSAGYGLDSDKAFPALIQQHADTAGCPVRVVNAGLPGETTAAGRRRVDWILRAPVDVFVLQLGGNDGLRGLPLEQTEHNLQGIIDQVRSRNPEARLVIAGMRLPPNLGPEYTQSFQEIFPRLAAANEALLICRLLEGVGGEAEFMQADGIHPNAAGHRRVARTVWQTLAPLLCGTSDHPSGGTAQNLQGRNGGDPAAVAETDQDSE